VPGRDCSGKYHRWHASGTANLGVLLKFTSYYKDMEVASGQLHYAMAREYSGRLGRFNPADPSRSVAPFVFVGDPVGLPSWYCVLLRLIRLCLSALAAYGMGAHGESLVLAMFVIPLPLDVFSAVSMRFSLRLVLSAAGAYLLGFRQTSLLFAAALMLIPIDVFFKGLAMFFPTPKLRSVGLPRCPVCQSEQSYDATKSGDRFSCQSCNEQLTLVRNTWRPNAWTEAISTAMLVIFIWALIYLKEPLAREIILFLWLLDVDLSLAFVKPPELQRLRLKSQSLHSLNLH
jgi:hypothetical protein